MDEMKLDMHIHSKYSLDGKVPVEEIIKIAIKRGMSGLCLADHNNPAGYAHARKVAPKEFILVPGCEVSALDGHILCYGTETKIPKNLPTAETIEKIHDAGGIAVASHPFRTRFSLGGKAVRANKFDGVEAFNARNFKPWSNPNATRLAEELKIGKTGGSDAHEAKDIGLGYLVIGGAKTADDVVEAIRKAKTGASGTPPSVIDGLVNTARMFYSWASRKGEKV